MSPTLALVRDTNALEQRLALIACGQRPGKTQACDRCRRKGSGLLNLASTSTSDAITALICGVQKTTGCIDCRGKAEEIIRVYNEEIAA